MKKLLEAGYGYTTHTTVVSMRGNFVLTFWGCACPLHWIGPSYDMESILNSGSFFEHTPPVMSQRDTLEELEEDLLKQ